MRYLILFMMLIACGGGRGEYLSSVLSADHGDDTVETAEVCVTAIVYGNYNTFKKEAPIPTGSNHRGLWKYDGFGHRIYFIKGDLQIAGHEFVHALLYESGIKWGDEHFDEF